MRIDPEIRNLKVPWPDQWKYKEPSKRADVRKLQWATAKELAEQDVWRDRLEALRQLGLPGDAVDRLFDYELEKLCQEMDAAGAKYPPTWENEKVWFELQGKEWHWSQSINHRRCEKIADEELRSGVYWLLEISQHKERIKASVLFTSILRVDPDSEETQQAFDYWKVLSLYDFLTEAYGKVSSPLLTGR